MTDLGAFPSLIILLFGMIINLVLVRVIRETMTRKGSKRLLKAIEKRDELIRTQLDYINYCHGRGNDLDTVHILVNNFKDRLREENFFLRQKMWMEGWRFCDYYVIDPSGSIHQFYWGMDRHPDPSEHYYFYSVIFCSIIPVLFACSLSTEIMVFFNF